MPFEAADDVADTLPQDEAQQHRARQLSLSDDEPPASVPGYQIQRKIGEGRFGSVWAARELNTGKQVAIKFYAHRRGIDWSLLGREVEKLAVLYTSRNIVGLFAVGWDHDPPYYVMEYLDNGSLAEKLESGPLPIPDAVHMATRVCQALVHAHGSGILHCDLKPANVLLDKHGEPRLCDFGQSRLVDERQSSLGTLFYMAPEQADLKAVPDARWDVYGLGALLHHMVTGSAPFRTEEAEDRLRDADTLEDQLEIYRQIVAQSPRPQAHRRAAGMDAQLADIIDRCLSVDQSRRLPNAQAVLDRLTERERQRSRRPLLVLGLILPLLLLLFTAPLASEAMYDAISTARSNLTRRALESDVLSVNLLASSLERELVDRREELSQIVDDTALRQLVQAQISRPRAERTELMKKMDEIQWEHERRREAMGRSPDRSWFLLDPKGIQRWRTPDSVTVDQDFSHRDYFHGLNKSYTPEDRPPDVQPIRKPHISRIYRSRSTEEFSVALTVPIWDDMGEQVIGVLGRSIQLSELLKDYEKSVLSQEADEVGRVLALIDSREWKLIAHYASGQSMRPEDYDLLKISDELAAQLAELMEPQSVDAPASELDRTDEYSDPMGRIMPAEFSGAWLAAFSRVGNTGWVAVVQERRRAAMEAVEELRGRMRFLGLIAVGVVVAVVAGCWWLIVQIFHDRPLFWSTWKLGAVKHAAPHTTSPGGKEAERA
ncbi:MAG: serine/threonine protein kinase [Planctomycetaceae bacterium]